MTTPSEFRLEIQPGDEHAAATVDDGHPRPPQPLTEGGTSGAPHVLRALVCTEEDIWTLTLGLLEEVVRLRARVAALEAHKDAPESGGKIS
jgi:hypothetical protein